MPRSVFQVAAFVLAACSTFAAQPNNAADRSDAGKPEVFSGDYILQPSDLLKVQVFQEDDLTREVRISQEYSITLPMINTIDLRGKTQRQAQDYIRELYARDYIKNPGVNLTVLEYAPRRVYVAGSVKNAGVVLFPQEQGLTLIDAISRAGSFDRLADKKRVTLKRTNPDGTADTQVINCEELMKGDSNKTYPLQPNDVITVPEKIY